MTRNNSDMAEPAPQRWAIYIISNRGEFLDSVEAPDEASAIIAAIKKFGIVDAEQQKRLVARGASTTLGRLGAGAIVVKKSPNPTDRYVDTSVRACACVARCSQ